jgi:hypothetical protein
MASDKGRFGILNVLSLRPAVTGLTGGRTHGVWGRDGGDSALTARGALDAGRGRECLSGGVEYRFLVVAVKGVY